MKQYLVGFFLIGFLGLSSCKKVDALNGSVIENDVVTSSFTGLDNQTGANVTYAYNTGTSITVTTTQQVFDVLTFNVVNNVLELGVKSGYTIKNVNEVEIHVEAPVMTKICISGSGNINADYDNNVQLGRTNLVISGSGAIYVDTLSAPEQEHVISGSGAISVNYVNATDLRSIISGSGNIFTEGVVANSDISISGSGWISQYELNATNADVLISGSGSCEVRASTNLDVTISGSGNVFYKGNPQINLSGSGSGNLIDAN